MHISYHLKEKVQISGISGRVGGLPLLTSKSSSIWSLFRFCLMLL